MKSLTNEDISIFKKNGYLIKRKVFNDNEVTKIATWIDEYQNNNQSDWEGKENAYYETSVIDNNIRILSRIEKFIDYHEGLKEFTLSRKLLDPLEDLVGEECVLFKEKINLKQSGGNGFRAHQDIVSRWDDFASYFMNIFITVDECTIENGCLEIAKGFTKKELVTEYDTPIDEEMEKTMEFISCLTSPGDIVFFDCFIPHRSKANLSNSQRRNIYLTYNKKSEGDKRLEYLKRKEKEMPPDNKRDKNFKDSPIHEAKYKETKNN